MYRAVLFSPTGDWVTDYPRKTIAEVEEAVANQGSRWIFYPAVFVIKDYGSWTTSRQLIVNAPEELAFFKRRSISTVSKHLKDTAWARNLAHEMRRRR